MPDQFCIEMMQRLILYIAAYSVPVFSRVLESYSRNSRVVKLSFILLFEVERVITRGYDI